MASIFLGGLIYKVNRDFRGYPKQGSACVSWPPNSANKVQTNLIKTTFFVSIINAFWKFVMLGNLAWAFLEVIVWSRNFFLAIVESPQDFFMFRFLPPFRQAHHLKSGVHPLGHVGRKVYFTTFYKFFV